MGTGSVEEEGVVARLHHGVVAGAARARDAGDRHVSIAVPFRAAERNRRFAASVLAGGIAYRLFSWLLPVALVLVGLGFGDPDSIDSDAATGDASRTVADAIAAFVNDVNVSERWLVVIGVPMLLWEGYKGAKALELIHALVWDEPAPRVSPWKSSLAFSGTAAAFVAAAWMTWWVRDEALARQILIWALMIVPLAAIWLLASLGLPHGDASWTALLPGAIVVAAGFQVTYGLVAAFLSPQLEKSTSVYGAFGVVTTVLFVMWVIGRVIVTAPLLNSSLHDELKKTRAEAGEAGGTPVEAPKR
jgi:uncharacterized BrkB/YihY/UPF0761 family membrane protein